MMTILLNPKGRLGPGGFWTASLILIVIGAILSVLPVLNPLLSILGILGLVLIYPWVVIWVKRLHDAGKSGWLFLVVLVLWLIVSMVAGLFVTAQFGPDIAQPAAADFASMMAAMNETTRATAIPNTIASVAVSLVFVLGGNALLKSDPGPNAYGPPPPR